MRKKPPKPSGLKFTYPYRFEQLWKSYPKIRGSKWKAFEAWWCLDLSDDESDELISHVDERIVFDSTWAKDKGRFVPMLSTWLTQRRWEEDYPRVPKTRPHQTVDLRPVWEQDGFSDEQAWASRDRAAAESAFSILKDVLH